MENIEIKHALIVIKQECESHLRCDDCPLCTDFGDCFIADKCYHPEDWDLERFFKNKE